MPFQEPSPARARSSRNKSMPSGGWTYAVHEAGVLWYCPPNCGKEDRCCNMPQLQRSWRKHGTGKLPDFFSFKNAGGLPCYYKKVDVEPNEGDVDREEGVSSASDVVGGSSSESGTPARRHTGGRSKRTPEAAGSSPGRNLRSSTASPLPTAGKVRLSAGCMCNRCPCAR